MADALPAGRHVPVTEHRPRPNRVGGAAGCGRGRLQVTCPHPRRVVYKAEALGKGPTIRSVVTSRTDEPLAIYGRYADRAIPTVSGGANLAIGASVLKEAVHQAQ
jgi:hypothetical protein